MKQKLKMALWGLAIIFVIIQFVPVERVNPAVTGEIQVPDAVKSIFETSCYDCHSNETEWPFYSYIAPVSWLVERDVTVGRKKLNFSKWDSYSLKRKKHKVEEIWEEVTEDNMPMFIYLITHPGASLDKEQKDILEEWCDTLLAEMEADTTRKVTK